MGIVYALYIDDGIHYVIIGHELLERCRVDAYCCVQHMCKLVVLDGIEGDYLRTLDFCTLGSYMEVWKRLKICE